MAIDFKAIAEEALRQGASLVQRWFGGSGRFTGGGKRYVVRNPKRADKNEGSFDINLTSGVWKDFAGGEDDKGGDLISLYAFLNDLSQFEAAKAVAAELGIDADDGAEFIPYKKRVLEQERSGERVSYHDKPVAYVAQVPDGEEAPCWRHMLLHRAWGNAIAHWVYRNPDGSIAFIVVRWLNRAKNKKEVRPICLCRLESGKLGWVMRWPQSIDRENDKKNLLPLYKSDILKKNPVNKVMITEGEKDVDAAASMLPPDWITTTVADSKNGVFHTDFSNLREAEQVAIWSDADADGRKYSRMVMNQLIKSGVEKEKIKLLDLSALARVLGMIELPKGHGAADITSDVAYEKDIGLRIDRDSMWLEYERNEYEEICESIENFWVQHRITPDCLCGFMREDTGKPSDMDMERQTRVLLHMHRLLGKKVSRQYILEAIDGTSASKREARRQDMIDAVTKKPVTEAGVEELKKWIRALTGRVHDFDLAVMRHWIWNVKRAVTGMPTDYDIMPILQNRQGSGKTSALKKLFLPIWNELAVEIEASSITDSRQRPLLRDAVIGFWDEMEGAQRSDTESVKRAISADSFSYRPMATNLTVQIRKCITLIGATNKSLEVMIQDTTGSRRFWQIVCQKQIDWDAINAIDSFLLWQCADERVEPSPITPHRAEIADAQKQLRYKDELVQWLEQECEEGWPMIRRRLSDAAAGDLPEIVWEYNPLIGYSQADLRARFTHWGVSNQYGHIATKRILGPRLKRQEGWHVMRVSTSENNERSKALYEHYRKTGMPISKIPKRPERYFVPDEWLTPPPESHAYVPVGDELDAMDQELARQSIEAALSGDDMILEF